MSKRRNENGQMRREEYEAADDRDSDSGGDAGGADGGFQRASEAALSRRKIVTARVTKRPVAAATPAAAAAPAPAAAKANPFAGFSGLASASSSEPAARANPFSGFSGLTSAAPAQPATTAFANGTNGTITESTPKTYQDAIEVLNKEFLDFVSEQLRKNPSSDWTAAVQDYLKHAQEIATKFASTKPVASCVSFSSPAPAVPSSSIPSFLSTSSQAAKKDESAASSTVSSGFSFGAKKDTLAPAPASSTSSGFSFGSTPSPKPPTSGGFSFGSSSSPSEKEPTTKSSGFSFGAKPADSKPAPAATLAFSFGAAKPADSNEDKAKPAASSGFSFGAAPAAPASTSGFSFSLSKPAAPATSAAAPASGGFSFALPAASTTSAAPFSFGGSSTPAAPAASTAAAAADDEDDENIGREEATVILKADNPDEDPVFETDKAKILEFKKDEKRWADKGTHPLKVLVNKEAKSARILVRNQIGKIVLNSSLYKGLAVKPHEAKGKKTGALLALQVDDSFTQFILKVNGEKVDEFLAAIEKATPQ